MGLRSHFPQLHAIEHVVLDTIDFAVPTLMEMSVKPVVEGMSFGVEIGIEIATHHKAFGVGEIKDVLFHTTLLHQICFHVIGIHILCLLSFQGRTPSDTP